MKSPELIATEIVNQFAWTSNIQRKGMLVNQQVAVSEAIAEAIETDRAESAADNASLRKANTLLLAEIDSLRAALAAAQAGAAAGPSEEEQK